MEKDVEKLYNDVLDSINCENDDFINSYFEDDSLDQEMSENIMENNDFITDPQEIRNIYDRDEIQSDSALAHELFKVAKQETTSRFVSDIAECELLLRIQSCYDLIRRWSVDFKISEIIDSNFGSAFKFNLGYKTQF